jgi:hypothetical protein
VEESAGVGATLTSWTYRMYDVNDQLLNENSHTTQEFSDWFTDCDGTGLYINPNGTRCTGFQFRSSSNEAGWYAIENMRFMDDNGHDILVEGRFTFMAIP